MQIVKNTTILFEPLNEPKSDWEKTYDDGEKFFGW